MKDLETIFRERRAACDGVVVCPIDDWNAIVSQVCDLESINCEMYAMLEKYVELVSDDRSDDFLFEFQGIKVLLEKVRGES